MALSKFSIKGRRIRSIMPGLLVGMLSGLLITASYNHQASAPISSNPALRLSEIERLSLAELETLTLKALSTLHEKRELAEHHRPVAEEHDRRPTIDSRRQVDLGIQNVRRLLPLARRLTLESLGEAGAGDPSKASGLLRERRLINAVHKIVLDPRLTDPAEVWDDRLSEIRISSDYAPDFLSDDEAIFLLGHELTHVAARSGRLNQFIENVTRIARLSANVEPTEDQREDLACDFTGAQVLKRFIALHPTGETEAERLSRVFGYETPTERLAFAWEDFCASYRGDPGDEDHLSKDQTIRALLALDPALKALLPDNSASALCP